MAERWNYRQTPKSVYPALDPSGEVGRLSELNRGQAANLTGVEAHALVANANAHRAQRLQRLLGSLPSKVQHGIRAIQLGRPGIPNGNGMTPEALHDQLAQHLQDNPSDLAKSVSVFKNGRDIAQRIASSTRGLPASSLIPHDSLVNEDNVTDVNEARVRDMYANPASTRNVDIATARVAANQADSAAATVADVPELDPEFQYLSGLRAHARRYNERNNLVVPPNMDPIDVYRNHYEPSTQAGLSGEDAYPFARPNATAIATRKIHNVRHQPNDVEQSLMTNKHDYALGVTSENQEGDAALADPTSTVHNLIKLDKFNTAWTKAQPNRKMNEMETAEPDELHAFSGPLFSAAEVVPHDEMLSAFGTPLNHSKPLATANPNFLPEYNLNAVAKQHLPTGRQSAHVSVMDASADAGGPVRTARTIPARVMPYTIPSKSQQRVVSGAPATNVTQPLAPTSTIPTGSKANPIVLDSTNVPSGSQANPIELD